MKGDAVLVALAASVAEPGPVDVVGGGSGGVAAVAGVREVRAPAGIVDHQPEEMTVRVRAGTPVAELAAALGERGQVVALPVRSGAATVGGALAVGRAGWRRLGWGPVRDALLEASCVLADGRLVRAGGPVVKNVTGYDLCRLLVGSRGTLAVVGEVVLRTRPAPAASRWFEGDDPGVWRRLWRPAAALWDGLAVRVLLEGHPDDVEAAASAEGLREVSGPLPLEGLAHRWSVPVGEVEAGFDGPFVAELGVGVVHRAVPQPAAPVDPALRALHDRVKASFDPTGRLAPGREVLPA